MAGLFSILTSHYSYLIYLFTLQKIFLYMKNVAVIGSGTMGNGIAHTFAQCGYAVSLIDISADALAKALATIGKKDRKSVV